VSDNYFLAENPAPEPASIAAALGGKYPLFESIMNASDGFEKDWKHYGKKYGWKLKAHDGEKALFELMVTAVDIRLSVATRESEMQELAELLPPGKSKGGWGIRLSVADEESALRAIALIKAVAALRQGE
jgi:hypothetical protein